MVGSTKHAKLILHPYVAGQEQHGNRSAFQPLDKAVRFIRFMGCRENVSLIL